MMIADFTPGAEALKKLGLEEDFVPIETNESDLNQGDQTQTKETTSTDETVPAQANGQSANDKTIESKKTPSGQPQDSKSELNDFQTKVLEMLKSFDDEDKQSKFVKDLTDYDKFTRSNTQKAMQLAEERKMFDQIAKEVGSKEIKEAIDKFKKHDEFNDFLKEADSYFDGKDKNPLRAIFSLFDEKKEGLETYLSHLDKQSEREAELALKEEILNITAKDPIYKETANLERLADIADDVSKRGISLELAAEIDFGRRSIETIKARDKKIEELSTKIKNLESELSKSSKNKNTTNATPTPGTSKVWPGNVKYKKTDIAKTFDEAANRALKRFGITD